MVKERRKRKRRKQKTGSVGQTDPLLTDNQQKMAEWRAAALVVDGMSQKLAVQWLGAEVDGIGKAAVSTAVLAAVAAVVVAAVAVAAAVGWRPAVDTEHSQERKALCNPADNEKHHQGQSAVLEIGSHDPHSHTDCQSCSPGEVHSSAQDQKAFAEAVGFLLPQGLCCLPCSKNLQLLF